MIVLFIERIYRESQLKYLRHNPDYINKRRYYPFTNKSLKNMTQIPFTYLLIKNMQRVSYSSG